MSTFHFYTWYETEHNKLHKAWSAAVGTEGYDKEKWLRREQHLNQQADERASKCGAIPPYLRSTRYE